MSASIVRDVLNSSLLDRELSYSVLIPENAQGNGKNTPVLFLLHGLFGDCDNWLDRTRLLELAKERRYIIVLPEGEDSWYVNSDVNGSFESVYLSELIPTIDNDFRTNGVRGIAGNSMGGYAAIKFAVRRPDLFKLAVSCSGAFHAPRITNASEGWDELKPSVMKVFGAANSSTREANDIFRILSNRRAANQIPALFMDCGISDEFLDVNREMSDHLKHHGIGHTYEEFEGGHDWEYWDSRLETILTIADEYLN